MSIWGGAAGCRPFFVFGGAVGVRGTRYEERGTRVEGRGARVSGVMGVSLWGGEVTSGTSSVSETRDYG